MTKVDQLLTKLRSAPDDIEFTQVIACIDANYQYTPCAFTNGRTANEAGANEGSCKVLAFAQMHGLSPVQALSLFGAYYRNDVLGNPQGSDHANIRSFMATGWDGVHFDGQVLVAKT